MTHGRFHWRCCCRPLLGGLLWVLSLLALVSAWIASLRTTGSFLGLPVAHLYWDALVMGVLAIGVKAGRGKYCEHAGMCDECMPGEEEKA